MQNKHLPLIAFISILFSFNVAHAKNKLRWVKSNGFVPPRAVVGGSQYGPYDYQGNLYICKARHGDTINPGKLIDGHCNITFGGKEFSKRRFKVLVARKPRYAWVNQRHFHPANAIIGGHQNGNYAHRGPLYICRARYQGNLFPGKIVSGRCNIGFGGREIALNRYQVLVRR